MKIRLLAIAWCLCVCAGLTRMWQNSLEPGAPAAATSSWPSQSRIHHAAGRPTLLLFAHPQCPCTRASLQELAEMLERTGSRLDAVVVFYRPRGAADWTATETVRSASSIRGARVFWDDDDVEARRFGSLTSGQTMLYDGDGRLRFCGGITAARGHVGDNDGRRSIEAWAADQRAPRPITPVFGCSLETQAPTAEERR